MSHHMWRAVAVSVSLSLCMCTWWESRLTLAADHVCVCVCVCVFVDIDECSALRGACANGQCINMAGSYRCDCHSGYRPSNDHQRCIGTYYCLSLAALNWYDHHYTLLSYMPASESACHLHTHTHTARRLETYASECVCVCVCVDIDVREGYCYYVLANDGRCLQHSDRVPTVTQSACCCTGGAAWGTKCNKCPPLGTGLSVCLSVCHMLGC